MGIASQAAAFTRNQRASGQVALPGSRLEQNRQLELVRAGLGVQPNRTPSADLRSRLNNPIPGSPGALPAPPGGGPSSVAAQGGNLGINAPPTLATAAQSRIRKGGAASALRSFLESGVG